MNDKHPLAFESLLPVTLNSGRIIGITGCDSANFGEDVLFILYLISCFLLRSPPFALCVSDPLPSSYTHLALLWGFDAGSICARTVNPLFGPERHERHQLSGLSEFSNAAINGIDDVLFWRHGRSVAQRSVLGRLRRIGIGCFEPTRRRD